MDWLWQNLLSTAIWELLLIVGVGIGLGYIKAKWPLLAPPVFYGVVGAACYALILFTLTGHSILSRQQPETTPENVEANIRGWCDYWHFGVQKQSDTSTYFAYAITIPISNHQFRIYRSKDYDHYLRFETSFPFDPEHYSILTKLPDDKKTRIREEVSLELAKSRVGYKLVPDADPLQGVVLQKLAPITASLTQDAFMEDTSEMDLAITVAARAFQLAVE